MSIILQIDLNITNFTTINMSIPVEDMQKLSIGLTSFDYLMFILIEHDLRTPERIDMRNSSSNSRCNME